MVTVIAFDSAEVHPDEILVAVYVPETVALYVLVPVVEVTATPSLNHW